MTSHHSNDDWKRLFGLNLGYIQDIYEAYQHDPASVEPTWRMLFEQLGPPYDGHAVYQQGMDASILPAAQTGVIPNEMERHRKLIEAVKLVQNIRSHGHLAAKIDPFNDSHDEDIALLDPAHYGLSDHDLKQMPAHLIWPEAHAGINTGWEAIQHLKKVYSGSLAFEFSHVHNHAEHEWLSRMVESSVEPPSLEREEKKRLLERLIEVEEFEQFLHRTFVGQKRFSIEGLDMLVPMLDELIRLGVQQNMADISIGMAHRGRLNVLAHVLGKPLELIFAEFHHSPNKDLVPSEGSIGINYGWTGDVKYHLGGEREIKQTCLTLANNPSHLEFVNPVVLGFTRAAQEDRSERGYPVQDVDHSFAILIHGDAAFPGEGVVSETLNLSKLAGYHTGGTVHIIANNRLGFTTDEKDSRSTRYASDLAKGFEIPIVHVNADDPEACLAAVRLAFAYRNRFHKDFLIDLIGYRRYGHNEADDPVMTQPVIYRRIKEHPTVRRIYAGKLLDEGLVEEAELKEKTEVTVKKLETAYQKVKAKNKETEHDLDPPHALQSVPVNLNTGVPLEDLKRINQQLLSWPEEFNVYPKLKRILERRAKGMDEGGMVDWAQAETLAFATILAEGYPIRLTGQDVERGTFAHRHMMLYDYETGKHFSPLHLLPEAQASLAIHNSPLTETAVLGFEYGYSVFTKDVLVIWEAQFGDFANVAQVMFDQFISSGRAKWGDSSNLIMLLPHGYEGQGPEHSSARLERFLQLAAENNWFVVNVTQAAQYFHVLRRQALMSGREEERPLIVMSPKSLIRHPRVASPASQFSEGAFQPLIEQEGTGDNPSQVTRIILCSGKIAIDLEEELEARETSWLHILRVEELYPFPEERIQEVLHRYPALKEIVWVQEEPRNMGAWYYVEPRLRQLAGSVPVSYIGRPERSSTAEGDHITHQAEQDRIIDEAFSRTTQDNE